MVLCVHAVECVGGVQLLDGFPRRGRGEGGEELLAGPGELLLPGHLVLLLLLLLLPEAAGPRRFQRGHFGVVACVLPDGGYVPFGGPVSPPGGRCKEVIVARTRLSAVLLQSRVVPALALWCEGFVGPVCSRGGGIGECCIWWWRGWVK